MDRDRFDAFARLVAATRSRRAALGALLAAMGLPFPPPADAAPRRKKGNGKRKQQKRKQQRRKRRRRDQAAAGPCCSRQTCASGRGKNLDRCCFQDRDLTAAGFRDANLRRASFARADLTAADFHGAKLDQTCFTDANLTGARFGEANLGKAILCRTEFSTGLDHSGCDRGTPCCPTCDERHPCEAGQVCCEGRCIPGDCCAGVDCPLADCDDADCASGEACCDGGCATLVWANLTTFGSGPGGSADQFNFPQNVAVSEDGQTVWVADADNNRISVWTQQPDGSWTNLTTFGSGPGAGDDEFNLPAGVAVSENGQIVWVADANNNRMSVWTLTNGQWSPQTTFGSGPGGAADQFNFPTAVAVAGEVQDFLMTDSGNTRISVWSLGCPA